jgi:putative addiction module component (TIGR02574 family)
VSTASEILDHALALPPAERASIAKSLIHSLPHPPRVFSSEQELAAELELRMEANLSGAGTTCDADEAIRRAREAVRRVRS